MVNVGNRNPSYLSTHDTIHRFTPPTWASWAVSYISTVNTALGLTGCDRQTLSKASPAESAKWSGGDGSRTPTALRADSGATE